MFNNYVIWIFEFFLVFYIDHYFGIIPRLDIGTSEYRVHHWRHNVDASADRKDLVPFVDSVLQQKYKKYNIRVFREVMDGPLTRSAVKNATTSGDRIPAVVATAFITENTLPAKLGDRS